MKRLLIDANPIIPYFISGNLNGIGRTNIELIEALNNINPNYIPFKIDLYTQNLKGISAKKLNTRFKTYHAFLRNTGKYNKFSAKYRIRELLTRYDLMHITHNFEYVAHPERCIVTIHDAMMFSYPEKFLGHDFAREHYPRFAQKAKAIITPSKNSKREIAEFMEVNPDKIFVTPWGINHNLFKPHFVPPLKYTNGEPYFCSVSCNKGRKNTLNLVKAYINFNKNNPSHHLVLFWKNPSTEVLSLINSHNLKNKIHFVYYLSNEELSDIYAGASCSFFPSRYEGFGLPIAESMACGTPVVTCDNSSLREVGDEVAFYVDPDDIDAMTEYMEKFENKDINKIDLLEDNLKQSNKFTWENCANLTLDIYKNALGV